MVRFQTPADRDKLLFTDWKSPSCMSKGTLEKGRSSIGKQYIGFAIEDNQTRHLLSKREIIEQSILRKEHKIFHSKLQTVS